jgi:hypothetical protein
LPATETIDLTAASLRGVFGDSEAACLAAAGPFSVARGPLTPDHIVYARSYPYSGDLSAARLDAFRARHGYAPRVVSTQHGVFGVGDTQKTADLALLLARDGALVEQLANRRRAAVHRELGGRGLSTEGGGRACMKSPRYPFKTVFAVTAGA